MKVPNPTSFTELKAFLGMVNYYGKFIPMNADLLAPLYALLKEKNFSWNQHHEKAFKKIKEELVSDRNSL